MANRLLTVEEFELRLYEALERVAANPEIAKEDSACSENENQSEAADLKTND